MTVSLPMVIGGVLVAALLVQTWRLRSAQADVLQMQVGVEHAAAVWADALAKAQAAARSKEQDAANALAKVDAAYARGFDDGKNKMDAVVYGVQSGDLRLRKQWRGCQTGDSVPEAAPAAGQPDAANKLRATGAGHLVRIIARCESQVRGLQDVIRVYRRTANEGAS